MDQEVFVRRRKSFMQKMGDGIAVFASAPVRLRNGDVEFEYRQDSDFYYLTGFHEPESVCVLAPGNKKHEYILFVRPRDKEKEIWNGYRAGVEGAMHNHQAEMAYTVDRLEEILTELLQDTSTLFFSVHKNPEMDQRMFNVLDAVRDKQRGGIYGPSKIVDPWEILAEMRLFKHDEEIAALQKAADITSKGHIAAMRAARPGLYEFEIQAEIEYVFRKQGSPRNGYPTIVGSGPNSCVLHYVTNSRRMEDGDLLLIDAGAEYDYYTADITRTFPVSGKFTPEQRDVYEVVLAAQQTAISSAKPGASYQNVHHAAVRALTEGMIHLGLLAGSVDQNIETEAYKQYYMHKTGHWLGMDVHDPGKIKTEHRWRALQPGMVMTVEPGIYIAGDDAHERFRNVGVRIEDDILITESGPVVLTSSCPKSIEDLEQLIGEPAASRS